MESTWGIERKRERYFSIQDSFVRKKTSPLPIVLEIEPTTDCTLSCIFCPRSQLDRNRGSLSSDAFHRVLENLGDPCDRSMLLFGGIGEPMLHGELPSFVATAKKAGWFCGITTNGTLVSAERLSPLLEAGLDAIQVSLHAASEKVYDHHVQGGSFHRMVKNIQSIIPLCKDRLILALNFTKTPWNRHETRAFSAFWKGQGVSIIHMAPCHNRGGALPPSFQLNAPSNRVPLGTCWAFRHTVFVTWNGLLLACCNDISGETVRGNLCRERLDDILKKEERQEKRPCFRICQACDFTFR